MSKHKKRKHKRVADPYNDYMQKRHAYWAACAKKGELTEEQAHTCDELEMFVSAVIVFSDISPKDIRTSPALSAAVMSTHGISDAAVHWAIGRSYARAVSRKSIRSRWKICAM